MEVPDSSLTAADHLLEHPPHREVLPEAKGTAIHVVQSGFEEGERWRRYYELVQAEWQKQLGALKQLLERSS